MQGEKHSMSIQIQSTAAKGAQPALPGHTDWADTELVFKAPFKNLVKGILKGPVTPFFEDSTESCHI